MSESSDRPRFSVIIPTYNRQDMVVNAVKSIVAQSYENWEVVVVDDGSADNTMELIQAFDDKRIRYLYIPHSERSAARNRGIKLSKGEYCCFLDSDDYYLPQHLSALDNAANGNPDVVLQTQFGVEGNDGIVRDVPITGSMEPVARVWSEFPGLFSYAFPRAVVEKHRFPEQFSTWEDRHFLLRVFIEYPVKVLPDMTAVFRDHSERSVNKVTIKSFDKRLQDIVGAVEDLFASHGVALEKWISVKEKRRKMAQMLIGMAIDARDNGMKDQALDALREARPYLDRRTLPSWMRVAGGALRQR